MNPPFPVLLADTTRWSEAARLAIALSEAGCAVSSICPARGHPLFKIRGLRQAFVYSPLRPLDSLAAAIKRVSPAIIIPCDDRSVGHLHELHASARLQGPSGRGVADTIERSLGPRKATPSYPIATSFYRPPARKTFQCRQHAVSGRWTISQSGRREKRVPVF